MIFSDDQFKAASSFAHTMIVVDDEPVVEIEDAPPPATIKTPDRRDAAEVQQKDKETPATEAQPKDEEPSDAKATHPLDTKSLIKSALDLGLVCSVVNPSDDEENVATGITKASVRADIVSLDWHMNHGDDGEFASMIIEAILCEDEEIGGRLRLIAIYTGNKNRDKILSQIAERLNESDRLSDEVIKQGDVLVNSTGLRLVWREKAMGGNKVPNAISEAQLPYELLTEFAKLSSGLLTNVALATIASMRDTTHHVLSKFSPELDGPFFHHRAQLQNSDDSMNYAVSVIMSALKAEVDKSKVTSEYITEDAIRRRLNGMSQGPDNFILRYLSKQNEPKEFKLQTDDIINVMEGGFSTWTEGAQKTVHHRQEDKAESPPPSRAVFQDNFSTLFCDNIEAASSSMRQFSFLTTCQSSELSKIHLETPPRLGLGSVIHSESDGYFLCLQATCDAVRGDGLFFFVPLMDAGNDKPEIVVPHGEIGNNINYVGLSVPKRCYTRSLSLNFGIINDAIGHIPICYDPGRQIYHVPDAKGIDYRWLANLKHKRALRIAQNMSREISRVGFDEFEPFRKREND